MEKKAMIRWRKERVPRSTHLNCVELKPLDQSYTSGKSKGGLDTTRAQAAPTSTTPRLFSSKQRRPSLFNSLAGQDKKKQL